MTRPVTLADLHSARDRIAPHILRTPLTHSYLLSQQAGCDIWLKQENRQHTGSFKPRGALNKIMSLSAEERSRGVVAASAGNHALGVAYACRVLGIDNADVFVQATAAPAKLAKLREYPVGLHMVGTTYEEAQQAALAHAGASGAVFVSAYDDPAIIAGQGTCGLEIAEDLHDFDAVIVPVGGGALSAGIAVAVKSTRPGARLIGVNAAASPSALLSFQRGQAIDPYDHGPTLAHGLAGGYGKVPFDVARSLIDEIVLVTEAEIRQAIVALIDSDQILAEASGAAGVAAVLARKAVVSGKVVIAISGGNIDSGTLKLIFNEGVIGLASNQLMNCLASPATSKKLDKPAAKQRMDSQRPPVEPSGQESTKQTSFINTKHDQITYQLIGLAMDIHNELGPGHREETYHNAFAAKLKQTDLEFLDEPEIYVELDDGSDIQKYIPDFIIEETVLIELKAQTWPMTRDDMAQVFDYFAGTDCRVALFFNFGRPRLDYHRLFPPKQITLSRLRKSKPVPRKKNRD